MRHHLRARRHGPDGHDVVLDPSAQARVGGHGHDLGRVLVQVEADGVGVVHDDIGDHPAARSRVVDAPALQMGRKLDRVEDADALHAPDPACAYGVADGEVAARVAQMVVGAEDQPRLTGGGDHRRGIGHAHGQRLFAKHMPARGDGGHGLREMLLVGGRDIDGVHALEQALEIRGAGCDPVPRRKLLSAPVIARQDRGDFSPACTNGIDHLRGGDVARADQAPTHPHLPLDRSNTFGTVRSFCQLRCCGLSASKRVRRDPRLTLRNVGTSLAFSPGRRGGARWPPRSGRRH